MRLGLACLICSTILLLVAPAAHSSAFVGFDIENAKNMNYYYLHFYVNQTLGNVFTVTGNDLTVTHLGVFDMTPDNEPVWDPEHPLNAQDGFKYHHAVALFHHPDMTKIAEVLIPAGTEAPIQDEGFRYLPLEAPVTLVSGDSYVLAAWWPADGYEAGGMDTFYLLGTAPGEIPSEVYVHEGVQITDGCFNPNAGDGYTCDAPFIFYMFWGLYAGGANFLVEDPVATLDTSWGRIKNLYR